MLHHLPQRITHETSAHLVSSSLTLTQTQEIGSLETRTSSSIDPLMNPDLGYGILAAVALACFATYLQSLRSQSDFILAPPAADEKFYSAENNATTFGDWKDISRPENYVLFKKRTKQIRTSQVERRWVFFALLLLFTPIFSFEFFLTISRQLVCAWNQEFCEPYVN